GKRNHRDRQEQEYNSRGRNGLHQYALQWHPLHSAAVIDGNVDPTGHSSRGYWRGKSRRRGPSPALLDSPRYQCSDVFAKPPSGCSQRDTVDIARVRVRPAEKPDSIRAANGSSDSSRAPAGVPTATDHASPRDIDSKSR